eukprot:TRINITY_DN7944_c0_g1_i1.p1 TRINITY_DN7944_c0_g1~~TRINITY_DN7944_c0_g1_i1.p1  ORF type:complete len:304 (+),score=91.84 TRINITY_DN7944_c0_g1_i1:98-1009(+)
MVLTRLLFRGNSGQEPGTDGHQAGHGLPLRQWGQEGELGAAPCGIAHCSCGDETRYCYWLVFLVILVAIAVVAAVFWLFQRWAAKLAEETQLLRDKLEEGHGFKPTQQRDEDTSQGSPGSASPASRPSDLARAGTASWSTRKASFNDRQAAPMLSQAEDAKLKAVLKNGLVKLDYETRELQVLEAMSFQEVPQQQYADDATQSGPSQGAKVVFRDEGRQQAALRDAAEVLKIYDSASVCIEGHTESASSKLAAGAREVALAQAELVKSRLIAFGIAASRLTTVGLPGNLGHNKSCIVLRITNF